MPDPTDADRPLKPAVAADFLGVSPSTLRWWRHKNRGPRWTRVGSQCRYQMSALREYLEQGEREGAEQAARWAQSDRKAS
jgi:predicted site-specific integrase-resolvase